MAIGKRVPIQVITKKALQTALLAKKAVDAATRQLGKEAFKMERGMKGRVPSNFGTIRSHIGTVGPKRVGQAVIYETGVRDVAHAKFVEFGTGPAGRESSDKITETARLAMKELGYEHGPGNFLPPVREIEKWLARKGLPLEMAWPVARKIGLRGVRAQPFVYPVYEERKDEIVPNVAAAVAQAMRT